MNSYDAGDESRREGSDGLDSLRRRFRAPGERANMLGVSRNNFWGNENFDFGKKMVNILRLKLSGVHFATKQRMTSSKAIAKSYWVAGPVFASRS